MKLILTLFIVFVVHGANAVTVRGGPSCADWLNERKATPNALSHNEFWLLGYISGLAVATNANVLRNTANTSLMSWVDSYCRSNSLHNLEEAGGQLFLELRRQKGL